MEGGVTLAATIPPAGGSLVAWQESTLLSFPAGTFATTTTVTYTSYIPGRQPVPGNRAGIYHFFDLAGVETATGLPAQPTGSDTVAIRYRAVELGRPLNQPWPFNSWSDSQWEPLPTSQLDLNQKQITAVINHFSSWGVLGETRPVYLPTVIKDGGG